MLTFRNRWAVLILLSLLALCPALGSAEAYKVIDEQGRVTFTDSPPAGSRAEKVEIHEANQIPAPPPRPAQQEAPPSLPAPEYSLAITYPPQDFHVTPGVRGLDVEISVQPDLAADHQLELTDNGELVPGHTLQNIVVRGTHVLQARVVDEDGNVLSQSKPIHIHVHRPSVGGS